MLLLHHRGTQLSHPGPGETAGYRSVRLDVLTIDEARQIAREPGDGTGDIQWPARTADGLQCREELLERRTPLCRFSFGHPRSFAKDASHDGAGGNAIHPHPAFTQFHR